MPFRMHTSPKGTWQMYANLKAKKLYNWRRSVASLVAGREKSVFAISIVTDDCMCSWVVLFLINAPTYSIGASGTTGLWRVTYYFYHT